MDTNTQKSHIEKAIARARVGVGERIDQLDGELRQRLDFKSLAAEHAPQLLGGGAALGFLLAFGFPKTLRRLIAFGVPAAMIAAKVKATMDERKELV